VSRLSYIHLHVVYDILFEFSSLLKDHVGRCKRSAVWNLFINGCIICPCLPSWWSYHG